METQSKLITEVCDVPKEVKQTLSGVTLEQWPEWWQDVQPFPVRVHLLAWYKLLGIKDLKRMLKTSFSMFRGCLDADSKDELIRIMEVITRPEPRFQYYSSLLESLPGLKRPRGCGAWFIANVQAYMALIYRELPNNAWSASTWSIMLSVCLEDLLSNSLYLKNRDFQLRLKPQVKEFYAYEMKETNYEDVLRQGLSYEL